MGGGKRNNHRKQKLNEAQRNWARMKKLEKDESEKNNPSTSSVDDGNRRIRRKRGSAHAVVLLFYVFSFNFLILSRTIVDIKKDLSRQREEHAITTLLQNKLMFWRERPSLKKEETPLDELDGIRKAFENLSKKKDQIQKLQDMCKNLRDETPKKTPQAAEPSQIVTNDQKNRKELEEEESKFDVGEQSLKGLYKICEDLSKKNQMMEKRLGDVEKKYADKMKKLEEGLKKDVDNAIAEYDKRMESKLKLSDETSEKLSTDIDMMKKKIEKMDSEKIAYWKLGLGIVGIGFAAVVLAVFADAIIKACYPNVNLLERKDWKRMVGFFAIVETLLFLGLWAISILYPGTTLPDVTAFLKELSSLFQLFKLPNPFA